MLDGEVPVAERLGKLGVEVEVPPAPGRVGPPAGGQGGLIGDLDQDEVGDARRCLATCCRVAVSPACHRRRLG